MTKIEKAREMYERACNEYVQAFCNIFDFEYDEDCWVAGDVGGVACLGDYFFHFLEEIKYCVDNNITDCNELLEWYDYCIDAHALGIAVPNFRSWHDGFPRMSREKMDKINELHRQIEEEILGYKKSIE